MHMHILEHAPFENPGNIIDWANQHHATVSYTRLYNSEPFAEIPPFDLLIIMGGPMQISDENLYPWIKNEKKFIRKTIASGKKVLGICLGAQFLAHALGGRVFRNNVKEIGWFPLKKITQSQHPLLEKFPPSPLPAFHWHSDTFDLPRGAIRLFESEATVNQGFIFNDRIIALQFHWEVKPDNIRLLLKHNADDLGPGGFIQSPEEMLNQTKKFDLGKIFLGIILNYLVLLENE